MLCVNLYKNMPRAVKLIPDNGISEVNRFILIAPVSYQSFRTHGSFVPRRFVPRLRRFVPTFDQFLPNPLVDSYPTNYDTKCLKQKHLFHFS